LDLGRYATRKNRFYDADKISNKSMSLLYLKG
jgi:hypothetical protein